MTDGLGWMSREAGESKLVLVAENEALIAMALAHEFAEAGHRVAGPFSTCAEASEWLREHTPDFAILDVGLHDGSCTAVAVELERRGIGFAVFSGSERERAPAVFSRAQWFDKPADLRRLIGSLTARSRP